MSRPENTVPLDALVELRLEKVASYKDPELPYVGLEHLAAGRPKLLGTLPSSASVSINGVFAQNDILFGKLRPNLRKSLRAPFPGYCSTDILVLRARDGIRPDFAGHLFQWEPIFASAAASAAGTKMPRTSWGEVKRYPVRKPESEAEQARIAAVLDTADDAIVKTEAVIAKLRQVRTGLIHDLLTCGLDENGHLRDPIAHPEQFQDTTMGLRPRDWEIAHIGIKCETYAGGTPPRGSPEFFGGSVPWIKSGEVNQDAISTTEETLSEQGLAISSAKWIAPGNPLMAMYGATAGQVSWLTTRATANQAVLAIIPRNDETVARFLFWMLRFVAPQIINLATGSGQPNLSKGLIDKALVAIPRSPDEQRAIATTIDDAVAIEKSETANLEKLIQLKSGLMDDLLTGRVRVPEATP